MIKSLTIPKSELERLRMIESKMAALEKGGVDNWEWYDESLSSWRAENEVNELKGDFFNELLELFGSNAYEPSETGAGFAIDIDEDDFKPVLEKFISDINSINQGDSK